MAPVMMRFRIKLPVHVATATDVIPLLEDRAAVAQHPDVADALRTAADLLERLPLAKAAAVMEGLSQDPAHSEEWRGQMLGCHETATRLLLEGEPG